MSMKDRVAVVGAGCTAFGEHFDRSYSDLIAAAAWDAMDEAGLGPQDIDAAWLGTAFPDAGVYKGRSGMDLAEAIGLFDVPITRVSNYCATGQDAFRGAVMALLAGECRVALAVGVEKLRDRPPQDSIVKLMTEAGHPFLQKGFTAAGTFAIYATQQMARFGVTPEDLAQVSVKNHRHAVLNPKAHHKKEIALAEVLRSAPVAAPLTLLECCPTTDGAAAVVLVRTEDAPAINPDHVLVKGHSLVIGTGWDLPFFDAGYDFTGFRATRKAAQNAYAMAGIRHPLAEIDCVELHDCFANVELLTYADLGLGEPDEQAALLRDGVTSLGGRCPVNTSGGLLSCGHPVGATGLRMMYEITRQLQGRAGARQVPNPRLGLLHNIGGPGAVSAVTILGAR